MFKIKVPYFNVGSALKFREKLLFSLLLSKNTFPFQNFNQF